MLGQWGTATGGYSDKQVATVLTVDRDQRRVEMALRDGGGIYAAVWEIPTVFRWPKVGETWTVRQDQGIWRLDALLEDITLLEDATDLKDLKEGHARVLVDSDTSGSGFIINSFHVSRSVSFSVGDGVATTFTLEHNLGTLDVDHEIREISTGTRVEADVTTVDANKISVGFGIAPTTNQYRVTFTG